MEILGKIRRMKEERGWSDYRLAKESGLRQSTISSLYKNNYNPTISTLDALCKAFGITLSQFFSDERLPLDLTDEQKDLLLIWNRMPDRKKRVTLDFLKEMA